MSALHDVAESATPGATPPLPAARGPLSDAVLRTLGGERRDPPASAPLDPLGDDDLHLGLYLLYELHYRGLPGVPEELEWDPGVLALRGSLERAFEAALRRTVPGGDVGPDGVAEELRAVAAPPGEDSLPAFVERSASLEQVRELLALRSAYQLKEADPHSWLIPRLAGPPKALLMEIQYDEYGSGDPAWIHAELFRESMEAIGLDGSYGAYVGRLPGTVLATVNLISLFGLHRRLRGALVGHLAVFEMTSSLPNRAYGNGLRRLGAGESVTRFFDEHVEADAVHEVLASDLAVAVASTEPWLAPDVVFGARSLALVEDRAAGAILGAWRTGHSALFGEPSLLGEPSHLGSPSS